MFLFILSRPAEHKPFSEYLCRGCGQTVARGGELITMLNDSVLNTFINPSDIECQVLTFKKTMGLEHLSWSTEEHTWFEGYAWRIALCSRCRMHLGWRFEAVGAGSAPRQFHGLLLLHLKGLP